MPLDPTRPALISDDFFVDSTSGFELDVHYCRFSAISVYLCVKYFSRIHLTQRLQRYAEIAEEFLVVQNVECKAPWLLVCSKER